MSQGTQIKYTAYTQGQRSQSRRQIVNEFPLRLKVNGTELLILISSPHQMNFLLIGFCYQQGFIDSLADILSLGICQEAGVAEMVLRHPPQTPAPTITTGCGGGLSYRPIVEINSLGSQPTLHYSSLELQQLQKQLQLLAENYRSHGGIHSAALGDATGLTLYAEDIGRHNCIDRLVGEAMFRKIDLTGKMLVTSGRISVEMAVKAARVGIGLIASRTSATDQAVAVCEQAGIVLIAYLRGNSGEIYTHQQRFHPDRELRDKSETGV